jgi:hypothetical protein
MNYLTIVYTMSSLYVALFILLCFMGLVYIYQCVQEGYGGRGRGGGIGRGGGWGRGRGIGRGAGYYGGPRRSVFYYPTYVQDYDTPDLYIYPAQNKMAYTPSFRDYLRWLGGYQ